MRVCRIRHFPTPQPYPFSFNQHFSLLSNPSNFRFTLEPLNPNKPRIRHCARFSFTKVATPILSHFIFPFVFIFQTNFRFLLGWKFPIPFGLNLRPLQTRQEFVNKISLTFTCDFRRLRDIYRAIGSVES